MRACASSSASFGFFCPTSAAWMPVAMVSPMAGHCGTRGRHSTSVSCSSDSSAAGNEVVARALHGRANSARGPQRHAVHAPSAWPAPANFHEVRACVSADVAQVMKSQVAFFALSLSAALTGKPQFQIEVTRLPAGPLGQRA